MRRYLLLTSVVICMLVNVGWAQHVNRADKETTNSASMLKDKERSLWELFKTKRYEEFGQYLGDDYRSIYSRETHTKDSELRDMREFELKNYSMSDMKITFPTRDTALITYAVDYEGYAGGNLEVEKSRAVSVWARRKGSWKIVFHTHFAVRP
jgi:hypothetical protein